MPFSRPSLTELRRQAASDINAGLPGVDALLRYSNLGILGDVLAALAHGHYGYLDWIALNAVPFTATGEFLEGWAALKGVTRVAASKATGFATFPATNGKVLPAGTQINRTDGISYETTAGATGAAGSVTAPIAAIIGGAGGNAESGTRMTLLAGISGITAQGAASSAIAGGVDVEDDDDLRSRMLAAYAAPAQGGSAADYQRWALGVPGVTRAWVAPGDMGVGTLSILFMMDEVRADQDGFPQGTNGVASAERRANAGAGDQLLVANAIFPLQTVTALVYAKAPAANRMTLTIAGLAGASADTKANISGAIDAALRAEAAPGARFNVSSIESAIASVPGTAGFVLTNIALTAGQVDPGSTGNIQSNAGALLTLATVTFA